MKFTTSIRHAGAAAAKANNLDQLKAAFGSAAGSCKSCHDNFRNN